MTQKPPQDIIDRFGNLPDLEYRGGWEYSSSCPKCGGARGGNDPSDRFRFWLRQGKPSNFWCRRCGFQGFADDNKPEKTLSEAEIKELDEVREREAKKEAARLASKIKELQRQSYWKGWHDAMTEKHRQMWRTAGIPDQFQDYWQLGYHANYQGKGFTSPALTIPYFSDGWMATTIQYRLLSPPKPSDKYRFQAGLKSDLWKAEPDETINGPVLLCEGVKKAAVTFIKTVAQGKGKFMVVSVPSKMPGKEMLDKLSNADPLFIMLDPDAYFGVKPAITRMCKMVSVPKRVIKLPCKADDFFTLHGGTATEFLRYLDLGRPV